jgi:hypothetical protein
VCIVCAFKFRASLHIHVVASCTYRLSERTDIRPVNKTSEAFPMLEDISYLTIFKNKIV